MSCLLMLVGVTCSVLGLIFGRIFGPGVVIAILLFLLSGAGPKLLADIFCKASSLIIVYA